MRIETSTDSDRDLSGPGLRPTWPELGPLLGSAPTLPVGRERRRRHGRARLPKPAWPARLGRWHNLTVWLSASTRREIEEGARALVKSARAQIDKLLDPRAPTFFTPRKYHSLRIGANEEKLVDCAYNFSRTIDHFTYIAEMANVWDLLTVEFLWERLGLLEAAGCPPQGHPERVRILTPPRRDEWDELEGLRRRKEEAEIAEADSLCRAYAPLFARFTLDQMANYLDKKPIPERWALITSCLTPGQLRKVERLAKAKYDEQLRHLAYLDECDARRRR